LEDISIKQNEADAELPVITKNLSVINKIKTPSCGASIECQQLNGGRTFFIYKKDISLVSLDDLREMVAEKVNVPKNSVRLRLREDTDL
jgi:hypothetical protein